MNEKADICLSLLAHAFDKRMVNTSSIPLTFTRDEPNAESIEAIQEGNEFLSSGKRGRFTDGRSLIEAAME